MKRNLFNPFVLMGMVLSFAPMKHEVLANSGYGGGSGTASDPYLISTPEELIYFNKDINLNGVDTTGVYYQLSNDIDFSGYDTDENEANGNWMPLASSGKFNGHFNGNGFVISNIDINLLNENNVGFFSVLGTGVIEDLGLERFAVNGAYQTGGLVACQEGGIISRSYVVGEVTGNHERVGGLVGWQKSGEITQSYVVGNVKGERNYVGGLIGFQGNGVIKQSYVKGSVKANYNYVGGVTGISYGVINQSYVDVVLSGAGRGGIVGQSSANVSVLNNYYNADIANQEYDGGGIGLSSRQMSKRRAKENMNGFDFETVWQLSNEKPLLKWQPPVPITEEEVVVNGNIETTILSLTVPTSVLDFVLNPNLEAGKQFISSELELRNDSQAPLVLEIGAFEQTTNVLNDVLPTKYSDWSSLNKKESKDFALALVPKVGEGWLSLNEGDRWVADLGDSHIGVIKGNSTVSFEFKAKHGSAFSETLAPQYRLTFIFGLQD